MLLWRGGFDCYGICIEQRPGDLKTCSVMAYFIEFGHLCMGSGFIPTMFKEQRSKMSGKLML